MCGWNSKKYLLLLAVIWSVQAPADMCRLTGVEHICDHLGEARHEAVLQVLMAEYNLKVMIGEVEGKARTLVLLGESHIKSEWEAKAGRAMLAQFPYRGLEGVRANTLLGNILVLPNALLLASLYGIMGYLSDQEEGSTIHEALKEGMTFAGNERVTTSVANVLLESNSSDAITVASSYLGSATLMNIALTPLLLGVDGYLLYQKKWFAALPLIASQGWLYTQMWPFMAGIKADEAEQFQPHIHPLVWFILPYRNQLMAANIHSSLSVNKEQSEMLVVMGAGHIPGVSKILREQYGFKPLPKKWELEREQWLQQNKRVDPEP